MQSPRYSDKRVNTNAPEVIQSTFQHDYSPKKISLDPRKKEVYSRCLIPFNSDTEYKKSYLENEMSPYKRYTCEYKKSPASEVPFKGSSTYADCYRGKQSPDQRIKKQIQPQQQIPFSGTSMYKQEFQKFNIPITENQAHKRPYVPNNAPFETISQYQQSYIQHGAKSYQRDRSPILDVSP